jgi:cytochrome c oxidase subunit 1
MGWGPTNLVATIGAFIIAVGGILFIVNVLRSWKGGAVAGDNPWDADSFEWAAASPPANYNFVHPPVAISRYPLWTRPEERVVVTGLRNDRREVLVTSMMDGEPHHRYVLPGSSVWPLISALLVTVALIGSVFRFEWYYAGVALGTAGLVGCFWPRKPVELEP